MAQEVQVVLMKAKSFTDGRFKFKQGVPVTMATEQADRYRKNYYFAVRTVPQAKRMQELERAHSAPRQAQPHAQTAEEASLPKRKTKKVKAKAKGE